MTETSISGRVLALDVGERFIGLAVSDELRLTARPLPTMARTNWKTTLNKIKDLVADLDVSLVVVGLPLKLNGQSSPAANQMITLSSKLRLSLKCPVIDYNEALTTFAAMDIYDRYTRNRFGVDSLAALTLLNDYLNLNH